MADPLSIAASVAGLLSLADSVFRGVFRYSREVSDAQRDIKALRDELQSVASVLHGIKLLTETLEGDAPHASFLRLEHIHACRAVLNEIQSRIAKSDPSPEGNKRFERAKQSLKWPFGKSRTSEMINELSRQKETLQLALQADSMADLMECLSKVQNIEDKVNQIHQKVESLEVLTRIRMDELRTKILDFFMVDDPSPNLRTAWNLRQPLTGLWLTESPRFREWLTEPQSKMWLSGIPGAGKTILAGAAVREALGRLESEPNIGVAFFFCDYKKKASWEIANILQALITQLGRQKDSAFQILEKYYNKIEPRVGFRTAPDVEDLRDLLLRQVEEFDQVLVVVDGLDECGDKAGEASRMLSEIVQFAKNISMALFSRHEADISDQLETDFDHISIAAHTEDISLYVGAELEKRIEQKRLRLGDAMLKDEIMSSLIEKAQGMFRWVACQLDALCECPTDADRRAALQEMPKDLPETYERILHRINKRHGRVQRLAQLSLKLIAIEEPEFKLTIPQLCQAVSTPDRPGTTLDKQAIINDEEIARICSSFIRRSINGKFFEFSHFSVREYLQDSLLLQRPELALYHISNAKVYHAIAVQSLRFLLLKNFDREIPPNFEDEEWVLKDICDEFPLYSFAAVNWPFMAHHARETGMLQTSDMFDLEKVLFHPKKSKNYQSWLIAFCVYVPKEDNNDEISEIIKYTTEDLLGQNVSSLHIATVFNLVEVGVWLIDHGALNRPKNVAPTVLDCAIAGFLTFSRVRYWSYLYQNQGPLIYKAPRIREVLLAHGEKVSDCAFWDSGKTMFYVAWSATFEFTCLSILQCVLASGWLLSPEDLSTSRSYTECQDEMDETGMFELVRYLNSSELHKSDLGHQLCALIWNWAINRDFEFTADKSLLPTEITISYDSLRLEVFSAIKKHDLESLRVYEHDPRFDWGMTTTDVARSLLHHAVIHYAFEVLDYLISETRCDIDKPDRDGDTPLHYAASIANPRAFFRLVEAGASLATTNNMGWNVFHQYADQDSSDYFGIEKLPELLPKNKDQDPFLKDILGGQGVRDSSSQETSFTNWKSINVTCCSDQACVWEIAARGGSANVLRALIDIGFPRHLDHTDRNPFHSMNYSISLEAFGLLKSQFPSSLHEEKDRNLPMVTFLSKCIKEIDSYKVNDIDANVIRALLEASPAISSTSQHALDFCCGLVRSSASIEKKKELLGPFLDYGFDMHPAAPSPSTLSQAWLQFPSEGRNYGSSSDSDSKSILDSDHESDSQSDHESDYEVDYELRSLMSLILDHVDANKLNQLDPAGLSIIHKTCGPLDTDREWFILELIKRGADVNVCGAGQNAHTPLVTHLNASSIDSALILLNSGADPILAPPPSINAVQAAVLQGASTFLTRLLELAKTSSLSLDWTKVINFANRNPFRYFLGLNILHQATLSGKPECFDLLVNKRLYTSIHSTSYEGYNCMHFAAWQGSTQMIEHLHKLGIPISHAGADGATPLHLAVQANQIGAVQKLLDLKAPMGADFSGVTPIMLAKKMKFIHILEALSKSRELPQMNLEGDVSIEKSRVKHWSSVMEGAVRANDYLYCESLLNDGCPVDVPLRNCGGCSPLLLALAHDAPSYGRLIGLFLSHSASVSKTTCIRHGSHSALEMALCLPRLCPMLSEILDAALHDNWTCISGALIVRMIKGGNTRALVTLLAHLKDNRVEYGHLLGCTPELVVTYIINGCGINNPLHEAVWQGKLEAVESLVEYGADIHAVDTVGTTSLHLCKDEDTAEYLLSNGATPTLPPWNRWYGLSTKSVEGLADLGEQVTQLASSLEYGALRPVCLGKSFLSSFLNDGNILDMEGDVGRSIIHLSLYSHATGSMILNGSVRLSDSKPFPWHEMCYPTHNASWISSLWRFYRRRFHADDLRQVSNLHPGQGWSPMCLATCTDDTLVMANCLEMGADIDFEGSPYGSALMAAAFSNRLKSVKFLVRNGAAIYYEGKEGLKSAVVVGWRCQRVIEWLIMDRFRDQEKLEAVPDPSDEVGNPPRVATGVWSSMVAPLRLIGDFERQPHESSFDYLLRLVVIKRDMRGKVVPLPRREALPK